jgi:hypothetical protein
MRLPGAAHPGVPTREGCMFAHEPQPPRPAGTSNQQSVDKRTQHHANVRINIACVAPETRRQRCQRPGVSGRRRRMGGGDCGMRRR